MLRAGASFFLDHNFGAGFGSRFVCGDGVSGYGWFGPGQEIGHTPHKIGHRPPKIGHTPKLGHEILDTRTPVFGYIGVWGLQVALPLYVVL